MPAPLVPLSLTFNFWSIGCNDGLVGVEASNVLYDYSLPFLAWK